MYLEPVIVDVAARHASQVDHVVFLLDLDVKIVALAESVRSKVGTFFAEFVPIVENSHTHSLKIKNQLKINKQKSN